MAQRTPWSRDELLAAFRLYHRTPFGRLHQHNPEIIALADLLWRTPSAVAMKTCNFASLDPVQQARNISGLGNVAQADRNLWDEFNRNSEAIAAEASEAFERVTNGTLVIDDELPPSPSGPTETVAEVRVRRVQGFFRSAVLTGYEYQCALSDIAVPQLLNASHIIPWSVSVERRAHPSNGICLNALYDRAFDRGLISFSDDLRVLVSPTLRIENPGALHRQALLELEGRSLRLPKRSTPDVQAMAFHREHRFRASA